MQRKGSKYCTNISYNTVWSGIRECNERLQLQTVLQHIYFMTYVLGL